MPINSASKSNLVALRIPAFSEAVIILIRALALLLIPMRITHQFSRQPLCLVGFGLDKPGMFQYQRQGHLA